MKCPNWVSIGQLFHEILGSLGGVGVSPTEKCICQVFSVATPPLDGDKKLPVTTPVFEAQKGSF